MCQVSDGDYDLKTIIKMLYIMANLKELRVWNVCWQNRNRQTNSHLQNMVIIFSDRKKGRDIERVYSVLYMRVF